MYRNRIEQNILGASIYSFAKILCLWVQLNQYQPKCPKSLSFKNPTQLFEVNVYRVTIDTIYKHRKLREHVLN